MTIGTDRKGAYLRAFLVISIAVFGYLQTDKEFLAHVPWWMNTALGAGIVGFGAWRLFLDQSLSSARHIEAKADAESQDVTP